MVVREFVMDDFGGFNPRAREGRDLLRSVSSQDQLVSIHAPVRGATRILARLCLRVVVSIHAPVRGATSPNGNTEIYMAVSIHAPVRGATMEFSVTIASHTVSIHAPVRGATRLAMLIGYARVSFQSTRP